MLAAMWSDMFSLGQISPLEKIIRAVIVYFFLMIGLRIAGKRELAQLNPFDLIVLLMLSNTVQNAIIGNDNSIVGGMIGAIALLLTNYVMVRFARRSRHFARLLEGRPEVLIRDGQLLREHLEHEMITRAELVAAAHKQGITSLHEVEKCVLEPTGTISFIQKRPLPDSERHQQIMDQLQGIMRELAALKTAPLPSDGAAIHNG